ncbi:MAG: hypothetical protein IPL35_14145 [Sphingobacteriales bacterium]|nr:hypothetical protein [Sphingobacteriales bacterium]
MKKILAIAILCMLPLISAAAQDTKSFAVRGDVVSLTPTSYTIEYYSLSQANEGEPLAKIFLSGNGKGELSFYNDNARLAGKQLNADFDKNSTIHLALPLSQLDNILTHLDKRGRLELSLNRSNKEASLSVQGSVGTGSNPFQAINGSRLPSASPSGKPAAAPANSLKREGK